MSNTNTLKQRLAAELESPHENPGHSIQDLEIMAKRVAQSRLFGMDEAQAFTLMLLAQSEGIHPIKAVQRYHVIQNRPAMKTDAMLADFQRSGGTVEWITESDDREKCEALFRHPRHAPQGKTIRFSMADAKAAGLAGKDIWKSYPASMMRARVVSIAVRMICPGIIAGLYTPEEIGDWISPIEVEARPLEAPAPQNGTDHGPEDIPPPQRDQDTVTAFVDWIKGFCDSVNAKWLDHLLDAEGHRRKGPAEIINRFQLAKHIIKWARVEHGLNAPEKIADSARDKYAAVAWKRDQAAVEEEARFYARKEWRDANAKLDPVKQVVPDDDREVPDVEEMPEPKRAREPGDDDQ